MSSSAIGGAPDLTVGMSLLTQGADQFTGTASYVRGLLRELARQPLGIAVHGLCHEHALAAFGDCAAHNVRLTRAAGVRVGRSRGCARRRSGRA